MTKHRFTTGNQAARKPPRATLQPFSCRLNHETVAKVQEYAKRSDLGLKSQGMVVTQAMHCLELHVMANPENKNQCPHNLGTYQFEGDVRCVQCHKFLPDPDVI